MKNTIHTISELMLTNSGIWIAIIASLIKTVIDLRKGVIIVWTIVLADTVLAVFVGGSMWGLVDDSHIALWQKVLLTFVVSFNSFLVMSLLTNLTYIKLFTRVILLRDRESILALLSLSVDKDGKLSGDEEEYLKKRKPRRDHADYIGDNSEHDDW